MDGLNVVIPHNTSSADRYDYYNRLRPTLNIAAPNSSEVRRAIDLDGKFALHPDLARGAAGVLLVGFAGLLTLGSAQAVTEAFVAFETEEVGALDEAIAVIPEGSRTVGLIFDRGSRHVAFSPFIHSVAWVQARRGGAVMFTFDDFPQSPVVFREDNRPPRVGPRWEWMPERVDVERDLAFYHYVLTRGGPGRIARTGPFSEIFHEGPWRVFRRRYLEEGEPDLNEGSWRTR